MRRFPWLQSLAKKKIIENGTCEQMQRERREMLIQRETETRTKMEEIGDKRRS